jgi:hypothetical protein
MKQPEKSTAVIITEGIIMFGVLVGSMEIFFPGTGRQMVIKYLPWVGGGLTAAGVLSLALKLVPKKEQPHTIMESIFRRCGICVKDGDQEYYPTLLEKKSTNGNWFLLYSLPHGLGGKDITEKLNTFQTALGEVEFGFERGLMSVNVFTGPLKEKVDGQDWLEQTGNDMARLD